MKNQKSSGYLLLAFVFVAIIGVFLFRAKRGGTGETTSSGLSIPNRVQQIKGLHSSEKSQFIRDPDVQRILREKYRLDVSSSSRGSVDIATSGTGGNDFLWPASDVTVQMYEIQTSTKVNARPIFSSPLVIYSWEPVASALVKQKVVAVDATGIRWITNLPKLVGWTMAESQWSSIGLPDLYGSVRITPTDPSRSNSGLMATALVAAMASDGKVLTETSLNAAKEGQSLWGRLQRHYEELGLLEDSSGTLFANYLGQGVGKYPMIWAYENQIVQFATENPSALEDKANQVRILYPKPTMWANHPLIGLTPNGKLLGDALLDPDIQKIAWLKYGFRSGLSVVKKEKDPIAGISMPKEIKSVIPSPSVAVMERLSTINTEH